MTKNHFEVLGLKPGVVEDEVKKAYRTLAKKWHPDKNQEAGAEDKFKEISTSYEYLINKDRREILERDLKKQKEPTSSYTYTFWSHNDYKSDSFKNAGSGATNANSTSGTKPSTFQYKSKRSETKTQSKENTKPGKKKSHWTDSFTSKNKNDKHKAKKPSNPMYDEPFVEDLYEDEDFLFNYDQEFHSKPKHNQKPNFSFAFKSFVDQLDSEFDTFFPGQNSFTMGLGFPLLNSGQPAPKPRQREVAHENGDVDGLDEDYLFTPRKGNAQHFDQGQADTKFKCNFCSKMFTASMLIKHELKCGKWKVDDDEEEDEESDYYNESHPSYFTTQRKPHTDWQDSHNDLINQIRQAKKISRRMKASHENESVLCKYCGIGFNKIVIDRHTLFCERRFKQQQRTFQTPDGRSKFERAKEYARDIPQSNPDINPENEDVSNAKQHDQEKYMGRTFSSNDNPSNSKSKMSSSKFRRPSSGLGVNGSGFGSKKHGNGCSSCSLRYGNNAKFYCSCGTKKSAL
ncbi:uncharacterized protein LOC126830008 [Patella vulgata]|uniref:uncharacterized protein LOC126830008 n=1 Tax=Patella vulgata TaxID=6465 RepID=UPI00217FC31A|nr:uncharacterized protein LOC126830008 [Patella vulgata]XP_050416161.1 uncharacterized protein LOC126830008 [Patella vulgata]XP_050416162.1 uncharacterized protein LOC126830008 [Patella vulgata]